MNKYQKRLNKLTRQQVKIDNDKLSQNKFVFSRGNGKPTLEFMKLTKYMMMQYLLQSKKYYRRIRICKRREMINNDCKRKIK